jgi:hypothetical protein
MFFSAQIQVEVCRKIRWRVNLDPLQPRHQTEAFLRQFGDGFLDKLFYEIRDSEAALIRRFFNYRLYLRTNCDDYFHKSLHVYSIFTCDHNGAELKKETPRRVVIVIE